MDDGCTPVLLWPCLGHGTGEERVRQGRVQGRARDRARFDGLLIVLFRHLKTEEKIAIKSAAKIKLRLSKNS